MDTDLRDKLDKLEITSQSIQKLLMGNGRIGVAEMARRSFEWMQHQSKTKNGLLDWSFRVVIAILLGFIAVKVGLK